MINFSSSSFVNLCELFLVNLKVAHSSRGLGHLPLKEEITGSNPVCATKGKNLKQGVSYYSFGVKLALFL